MVRRTVHGIVLLAFATGLVLIAVGLLTAPSPPADGVLDRAWERLSAIRPPWSQPRRGNGDDGAAAVRGQVARFQLEAFGVDSAVERLGLEGNALATPSDPHATGWYSAYGRPGQGGNALFAAHIDYWPDVDGPFYHLAESKPGDRFQVVMADGTRYIYEFVSFTRYDAATTPMGDVIDPPDRPDGEEWITMLTCGGTLIREYEGGPGHYLQRDVVTAKLVETIPG